jgi:hypothetical protein
LRAQVELGSRFERFISGLIAVVLALRLATATRTNESVAQRFSLKKSDYEQLRNMLVDDKDPRQIAPWGVRTPTRSIGQTPPIAELALDRYQKYLGLLSNIEAAGMTLGWSRSEHMYLGVGFRPGRPMPISSANVRYASKIFSLGDRSYVERDTQSRDQ